MKEHKKDCYVIQLLLVVGVFDTIGYDGGGGGGRVGRCTHLILDNINTSTDLAEQN